MNDVTSLHREAMGLVDRSMLERAAGRDAEARVLLAEAYEKEARAARALTEHRELEPTRSVLHRSAASLAIQLGQLRDAEQLISSALSAEPPEELAEELRDLLEDVYFHRHLQLRGIILEPNELQFSLAGDAVGFGIASTDFFLSRVSRVETVIYRTAERLLGRPYRDRGRKSKKLAERLELYLSVPRAASFSVTFRIGHDPQLSLPGIDFTARLVDEVFDCVSLFDVADENSLRTRIPDPAYYRNFVGLARQIAPDGKQIRTVGFTAVRLGAKREAALRHQPRLDVPVEPQVLSHLPSERVTVTGALRFADALRPDESEIRLLDDQGAQHKIRVPEGMMSDIVRPLWDSRVTISGRRQDGFIILETIDPADEEGAT